MYNKEIIFHHNDPGVYCCTSCGNTLFEAAKKFDACCGFPSFWLHVEGGVKLRPLHTYGRSRTQLLCVRCGTHLGHLFQNKYTPNGLRYCVSKNAIVLER
ncbi:peptide-methionine (R)-S-oxide reductase [Flavisolibacter ginsenosidimutans]|uniref:peptide-methionine (R)-S-oxide reductase n=1 Tax=Flavisolibacter ginsenosidimutans TaxID=661481 RepID=A0A5B8UMI1_9BACT|nr:peptide-methionine (R)-S-oxide reductase [Flavisolibacter ginsenosidimutans]QEC57656.1 peptide-methionine (R)-S-oxide reductase [Flavisolibacter ginsenosidimutans]